jgi:hypothetical protein
VAAAAAVVVVVVVVVMVVVIVVQFSIINVFSSVLYCYETCTTKVQESREDMNPTV